MIKVLFVCMGNICRSPTAHGVFAKLVKEQGMEHLIQVNSAGTHDYHVGEPPDKRAQAVALRRGINLSGLRGRHVTRKDLDVYDYVLAMDSHNLALLQALGGPGYEAKTRLFLEFAPHYHLREVPDPYYGGENGFEQVLDMIEVAAEGLLADIRKKIIEPKDGAQPFYKSG